MSISIRSRRGAGVLLALLAGVALTVSMSLPAYALDGTVDPVFAVALGTGPGSLVLASAVQPDGDILVGGRFTDFDGTTVPRLVRLHPDGTLDTVFEANLASGFQGGDVTSVALQPGGRILVAGFFTTVQGTANNGLAALNADGSVDTAFMSTMGDGAHAGYVSTVLVEADGSILAGGKFLSFSAVPSPNLVRLLPNGTVDSAFGANLGTGFDDQVFSLGQSPDGTVLVGGAFDALNGIPDWYFGRLGADGTPDTAYNAHFSFGDGQVYAIDPRPDGSAVVGGAFTNLQAVAGNRLARINPDGSRDLSFDIGAGFDDTVYSLATLSDGSFLVGGAYTANDPAGSHLSRVETNGTIDQAFTTQLGASFDDTVYTISTETSTDVIVGGAFTTQHLARVGTTAVGGPTAPSSPTLAATGSADVAPLAATGFALLLGGVIAVWAVRRVRRTLSVKHT